MHTTILRLVAAAPLATASPLLLVLALSACSATPPPTSGAADLAAMPSPDDAHVVLVARGMACPKCVTNADLQLMRIPGVRKVEIDAKMAAGYYPPGQVPGADELKKPKGRGLHG